ncbi:putative defense protein Hdd11-like isoform X2 [Danaus plexippus]|uniref:putative defense protein Hdd11-like isoform X2 n=1 Tax=Danaus plexippus TaxID=13037 RepID=UPI002AB0132E|nr:putative defense protein Hdd11-like isoform X2 [Danaus plexippus]
MTACPSKALGAKAIYSFKLPRSLRSDPLTHCETCAAVRFELKVSKMFFSFFVTILAVVAYTEGFSHGAPESACRDLMPRHQDHKPQTSPPPYAITTSVRELKAGDSLRVTVEGKTPANLIRGIMLQARAGDDIVGLFKLDPNDSFSQLMNCGVLGDTITHKKHDNSQDKQTLTYTWTAPANLNDKIVVGATIALNKSTFWVDVKSAPVKIMP